MFIRRILKAILTSLIVRIIGFILVTCFLCSLALYTWVQFSSSGQIKNVKDIKQSDVALVLGAGLRADGTPTSYLQQRLDAAKELYDEKKIRVFLLSGDNSVTGHNEPQAMADYLASKGVSRSVLIRDFAGFDTHDSCVRAKDIFGVKRAVVVTQDYHIPRATFLCKSVGIETQGVGVSSSDSSQLWYYKIREYFASDKAAIDVILNEKSKVEGNYEDSIDKILNATKQ
jgi:vancomycin permeability regulator SanA